MATWTPDPTFYASPRLATQAPPEKHAYVAEFDPGRRRPDRLAVIDVDPPSSTYAQILSRVTVPTAAGTSCITSAGTPVPRCSVRTPPIRTWSGAT